MVLQDSLIVIIELDKKYIYLAGFMKTVPSDTSSPHSLN